MNKMWGKDERGRGYAVARMEWREAPRNPAVMGQAACGPGFRYRSIRATGAPSAHIRHFEGRPRVRTSGCHPEAAARSAALEGRRVEVSRSHFEALAPLRAAGGRTR